MNRIEAGELVNGFENGTLPKEKWTHEAHFVMALWYTYHRPLQQARKLIKEGIKNYNLSVGGKNTDDSGYHETITELYIQIIVQYQLSFTNNYDFDFLLEQLFDQEFLNKEFPFKYYTKEWLLSKKARKQWVEPDRKDLPSFKSLVSLE